MGAVRRFLRRRFVSLPIHGFTLRASPAVTHGVSPLGTVGEHGGSLLFSTCPHMLCAASSLAVKHGVSPPGTVGEHATSQREWTQ